MSGQFQTLQKAPVPAEPSLPSATSSRPLLQRRAASAGRPESALAPAVVHDVLRTPGQPLDATTRNFMEPRFGRTFGQVRVHAGERAAESAQAVNATAFTVGQSVVFGKDRYRPGSVEGRHLLAHELAHVVQQAGTEARTPDQLSIGEPGTGAERRAEQAARAISSSPASVDRPALGASGTMLQRQETPAQTGVPTECPKREPDATAVAGIIQGALSRGRSAPYSADELQLAWYGVRQQREKAGGVNCCSAELAAAEHYMYSRYAVTHKDYAPGEMKIMIWGYGYLKFLVPNTGICPKSPDTQGSRDWAYKGVDDAANIDLFHENLS